MGVLDWLKGLVVDGPFPPFRARAYRLLMIAVVLGSAMIAILNTLPDFWHGLEQGVALAEDVGLALLALDYILRLWLAHATRALDDRPWRSLARYAASPYGLFDFLAVMPFLLAKVAGLDQDVLIVFGIMRFLKLARFSPALETLGDVILVELRPLLSALFIMVLLIIVASTLLYFVERGDNPGFASVPHAMWWAVATLSTLGYGDVVPVTGLGKVLGGGVAILGLCMFALPASILASGFTEEMRRQNFVSTWHLVAKVPFFNRLQATQIAEVAQLLKLYRSVRGEVIVREGDVGENMYFIVNGQVEVSHRSGSFILRPGDFFGEIALLDRRPRTATVRALSRCQLLILDAHDFNKFVAGYPNLLSIIRETAQARLAANQADSGQ